jgi:hypothetical protein
MTGIEQGEKTGIQAAIAELHDPSALPSMQAEQLPLLPAAETPSDASKNGAETHGLARGAGRPKGAKNRSTEEWKQFILAQHKSPLLVLAEIASGSIEDLAKRLGHDPANKLSFDKAVDLLKIQLGCAKEFPFK